MNVHLGISTCPNDTFAFHALLAADASAAPLIDTEGLTFNIELLDVEELNTRFAAGDFDVAKLSFAAMLHLASALYVLPAGAALGFGVGPVVLARPGWAATPRPHVLCPGEHTTATLLWRLFHPAAGAPDQTVFHAIMPALAAGRADLGVCIHEGRFTFAESGLTLFEDLGARWEAATHSPLPLGGIAARRSLGPARAAQVARVIQRSIDYAHAHPDQAAATMARYAQDQSRASHFQHVELYVNDWTRDLFTQGGPAALSALSERAVAAGLAPGGGLELVGFDGQLCPATNQGAPHR